jgi:hypothetical protein
MLRGLANAAFWVQDGRVIRGRVEEILTPERIGGTLGPLSGGA